MENIDKEFIEKVIKDLDPKLSAPQNDIPAKMLKPNADFVSPFISRVFNESTKNINFPDHPRPSDLILVYKKNNRND